MSDFSKTLVSVYNLNLKKFFQPWNRVIKIVYIAEEMCV